MISSAIHDVPLVVSQLQLGPHTGQALGWAWKRRSSGIIVFLLAVRAHLEGDMVVSGRS